MQQYGFLYNIDDRVPIYEGVSSTELKHSGLEIQISVWKNLFKGNFYFGNDNKSSSSQLF